jgi:methionine-rich copper-binding protein CopC
MRTRILCLLLVVAAWTATPSAFFHFELLRSSPSAKAALTMSPAHLQLWFSQVPAAGVSTITLSENGKHVALGKTVITASDKSMSADPLKPLLPGSYLIHWRGAGDDGHVQQGDIAFSVTAK